MTGCINVTITREPNLHLQPDLLDSLQECKNDAAKAKPSWTQSVSVFQQWERAYCVFGKKKDNWKRVKLKQRWQRRVWHSSHGKNGFYSEFPAILNIYQAQTSLVARAADTQRSCVRTPPLMWTEDPPMALENKSFTPSERVSPKVTPRDLV